MNSIQKIFSLLGLFIMTTLGLSAQAPCAGLYVEVQNVSCETDSTWFVELNIQQGNSPCQTYIDPFSGLDTDFGTAVYGSLVGSSLTLELACAGLASDSCFTSVVVAAPAGCPLQTSSCGLALSGYPTTADADCGEANGTVSFDLTGNENYRIELTNLTTEESVVSNNSSTFTGLSNGDYSYEIYCANNELAFDGNFVINYRIGASASINMEIGCNSNTLTAEPEEAGDYTYLWSTGETTQSIVATREDTYAVTVTDPSGCQAVSSTLNSLVGIDLLSYVVNNSFSCDDVNDRSIQGTPQGGVPPYTFNWSNGSSEPVLLDIPMGIYTLTVTDANGCTAIAQFTVFGSDFWVEVYSSLLCDGSATLYTYIDSSAVDGATFVWTDDAGNVVGTEPSIVVSEVGMYTVNVTNSEGCVATGSELVVAGTASEAFNIEYYSFPDTIADACNRLLTTSTVLSGTNNNISPLWQVPGSSDEFRAYYVDINQFGPGWYTARYASTFSGCPYVDSIYVNPEDLTCSNVKGYVYFNQNADCSLQDEDIALAHQQLIITETSTATDYYTYTDQDGNYSVNLPVGSFSVRLGGTNTLLEICEAVSFDVLESGVTISAQNVAVIGTEACPRVTVNTSVPLLRRCFDNLVYINYENTGVVTAENVVITVEVGAFAEEVQGFGEFVPDEIVTDAAGITTVTFTVDSLAPFEGGRRTLALYSCSDDFPLGAAACITTTVTPNNPCPPADPAWTGASLRVEGECEEDVVKFRVLNVGDADMSGPLRYVVIEDGVLLTPQPNISEPVIANDERIYTFEATGSTYHFRVEQEPSHPGLAMPIDFVEGCGSGQVSYGYALQFPLSDDAYWIDEECNELIGSYDPNDKRAMPRGYSENSYIEAGQMLDYTIRFQNTGTDTAFTVIVRDTLSDVYDLTTLEITGSTHDVAPVIDSSGHELTFIFDNIMLPDSFVNEPASHGAVSFRVMAREDLAPSTDVDNGAAIYFDFNEAVPTNIYHLEIEEEFVTVGVFDFTPSVEAFNVFPNPTNGPASIELPAAITGQALKVEVFDLLGRQHMSINYSSGSTPQMDLSKLPAGWYSIRLSDNHQVLGAGRVLLQ